jgi:hypothetical protein
LREEPISIFRTPLQANGGLLRRPILSLCDLSGFRQARRDLNLLRKDHANESHRRAIRLARPLL